MNTDKLKSWKVASKVLLVAVFGLLALRVASYLIARYQLDSPLIPKETVNLISNPHLYSAGFLAFFGLLAIWMMTARKYLGVIIVCAAAILLNQFGHPYALFSNILS
ncbi:hypothetical protein [Flaviaesturariibacter amylovorans]|uniref:hypothetical protein n=1 Tax=Flaviaesturariibacter amylovorans TaxID=1084520 RepID=UPI0031ED1440